MTEKVKREIRILQLFDHPHIIKLFEVINTAENIYLVMEYIKGGELYNLIERNGRINEQEARLLFQHLVSGVEHCHQHMVVHRDLKPENILLEDEAHLKLADFGLSNLIREGEFFKTSCGSPNYAAPEVISGKKYCSAEVDVWSCGVILYALLAGSLPFDEESIPVLFAKIRGAKFTIPYYFSEQVRDIIMRMLTTDPIKRITIPQLPKHP